MKRFHALVAVAMMTMSPAFAGVYGDDLTRCLVEKSTTEEKIFAGAMDIRGHVAPSFGFAHDQDHGR